MKNYKIAIGEQLKEARLVKKLSLYQAGDLMNVDHSTVKKWESGTNNISAADLIKYLQILEVDIEQFIRKVQ